MAAVSVYKQSQSRIRYYAEVWQQTTWGWSGARRGPRRGAPAAKPGPPEPWQRVPAHGSPTLTAARGPCAGVSELTLQREQRMLSSVSV